MVPSFTKKRRTAAFGAIVLAGVVLAALAGLATYFSLSERIRHYQVDAAVQADGTTLVRETIDYDFGSNDRHGIFRDFPGYGLAGGTSDQVVSDVRVRSATAPAEVELSDDVDAEIRVGNPYETVSGQHRYVLEYRITGVVIENLLGLDVIGTGWEVPIDAADIRLTAPYRLTDVDCYRGAEGSAEPCETLDAGGDVVTAHVEDLDEGRGVTIDGRRTDVPVRTGLPGDVDLTGSRSYWTTIWLVLGFGAAGYALGTLLTVVWLRRRGRDRAWAGGGIDAVFGGPGLDSAPITDKAAERQVTMQFEPPRDLTPPQGGVLLTEKVERNILVAWLTQQSIDGLVEIEASGDRLHRTASEDQWESAPEPLRKMFGNRKKINLRAYDPGFAGGMRTVDQELKAWRDTCELWDHAAEKRNRHVAGAVKLIAIVAVLAGAVFLFAAVSPMPVAAYVAAAVSAFFAGAGLSTWLSGNELPVRTPAGFARRQLVEGFRRFFAASEGRHAREAAERGELRLYSAWAVALGELDRWNAAMAAAQLPPSTSGVADTTSYVALNSYVGTATSVPSSSGSGGSSSGGGYSGGGYSGGGGSVGDGGGGGGGGSW